MGYLCRLSFFKVNLHAALSSARHQAEIQWTQVSGQLKKKKVESGVSL